MSARGGLFGIIHDAMTAATIEQTRIVDTARVGPGEWLPGDNPVFCSSKLFRTNTHVAVDCTQYDNIRGRLFGVTEILSFVVVQALRIISMGACGLPDRPSSIRLISRSHLIISPWRLLLQVAGPRAARWGPVFFPERPARVHKVTQQCQGQYTARWLPVVPLAAYTAESVPQFYLLESCSST